MATVFDDIDPALATWISAQPIWFLATAPLAADGHVIVSPRGHDTFSVLGPRQVGSVDYPGSGVDTSAHLRENGRVCIMFASFDRRPRSVRLHAEKKGPEGLADYRAEQNTVSLDGLPGLGG